MADMLNLVWAAAADRSRRGPLWASTSYASPVVDPAVRLGLGHRQLDPGCAEPIDRLTSATSFGEGLWHRGSWCTATSGPATTDREAPHGSSRPHVQRAQLDPQSSIPR